MKETLLIQQQLPSINVDESSTPLFFSIIDFIYACLFLSFHNILIFGIEMYDVIHSFFLFSFFFFFCCSDMSQSNVCDVISVDL